MQQKREVTLSVFRFNPQVDRTPYFDDYRIQIEKGVTVLRSLNYIKEHIDASVSFRGFCQAGICGSCGMRINGSAKLACTTQVWDELGRCAESDTIRIEPLRNMPLVKDLVVDMEPLVERMKRFFCWVESAVPELELGRRECRVPEEEFLRYDRATDCILCSVCLSECPVLRADPQYVSPAVILKVFRMHVDSRDTIGAKRFRELIGPHGILECTGCFRCQQACSKSIPLMDAINSLRRSARRPDDEGARG